MEFQLPAGIAIDNIEGLKSSYQISGNGITALLSNEKLIELLELYTDLLPEPIFFFIEIPCDESEERALRHEDSKESHYRLYYLDNCTRPVIKALIECYGELLTGDGVCRFGFGQNGGDDELYVQDFKVIDVSCSSEAMRKDVIKMLKSCCANEVSSIVTPWEILSDDNEAVCTTAEVDDFTVFDIPTSLEDAGMYFDRIV